MSKILMCGALWAMGTAYLPAAPINITGASMYGTNNLGAIPALGYVWNTTGGDLQLNLYIQDSDGNWLNSGNGAGTSISIGLDAGTYTFYLFGSPGLTLQNYAGLSLFFDSSTTPGVSGYNSENSFGPLSVESSATTGALTGISRIPGAGTVTFNEYNGYSLTLVSFELYRPGIGGPDLPPIGNYVRDYNNVPDLLNINDYRGEFTVLVLAPEPGTLGLVGLAAAGLLWRRRKSAA